VPLFKSCLKKSPSYSEVTRAFCRVPSRSLSLRLSVLHQLTCVGLRYGLVWFNTLHFLETIHCLKNPITLDNLNVSKQRLRNINLISIDYGFRHHLRSRLTLPRLTWDRKPWVFGGRVFHSSLRYLCQNFHFCNLQQSSRFIFFGDRTLRYHIIFIKK